MIKLYAWERLIPAVLCGHEALIIEIFFTDREYALSNKRRPDLDIKE